MVDSHLLFNGEHRDHQPHLDFGNSQRTERLNKWESDNCPERGVTFAKGSN